MTATGANSKGALSSNAKLEQSAAGALDSINKNSVDVDAKAQTYRYA